MPSPLGTEPEEWLAATHTHDSVPMGSGLFFGGMRFVNAGISLALAVLFRELLIVGAGGLGGPPSAVVWKGAPGTRMSAEADFSRVFPSTTPSEWKSR